MYHKLYDALNNAKRGDRIIFRYVQDTGTIMHHGAEGEFVKFDKGSDVSRSLTVKIDSFERKFNPRFVYAIYDKLTNEQIYQYHAECAM